MIVDPADDRARLDREVRIHKRLRELLLLFSRNVSGSLGLPAALAALTPEIRDLYGAGRGEIWLPDRRNRQILLAAVTPGDAAAVAPVTVDDTGHYASSGMRLDRPKMRGQQLVAPLRGWRRGLGALVIERSEQPGKKGLGAHEFIDYGSELARQLSVAIENVLLLDDILRQRRLLEDTFNSL